MEFIRFLLDKYIKNKFLITTIIIVTLLSLYKKFFPAEFKLFSKALLHSKDIIISYWLPLLLTLLLFIAFIILLRISDKKYWDRWHECHPRFICFENEDNVPIAVQICESKDYENNNLIITRTISIKNKSREAIDHIKGRIDFLNNSTITFSEEFELTGLSTYHPIEFYHEILDNKHRKQRWNSYDTTIETITIANNTRKDIFQMGIRKLPNYDLILDTVYIGFGRYRYEATWLKKEFWHKFLIMIRFYFRHRNIFYKSTVSVLVVALSVSGVFLSYNLLFIVWQLCSVWVAFFHKIVIEFFS